MATRRLLAGLTLYIIASRCSLTNGESFIITSASPYRISVVSGETQGWFQIRSNRRVECWPYNMCEEHIGNGFTTVAGIEDKSVLVNTGDTFLNIFVFNYHDTYHPLPIAALGNKYVVSSCHTNSTYNTMFVIATHSLKTDVNITFRVDGYVTYEGRTYKTQDTLALHLTEYQTFTLKSEYDLSGTRISSTETVAVFSGIIYSGDVRGYDQLLPIRHYGKEYVVAVDDNTALYQLQIVSEYTDVIIMFNNGSTASTGYDYFHRGALERNKIISFTTTKHTMATLCRERQGETAFGVLPSMFFRRQRGSIFIHVGGTAKILTEKNTTGINVIRYLKKNSFTVQLKDVPGSRYQVGSISGLSPLEAYYITSETGRFIVIAYSPCCILNGGYNFFRDHFPTIENTASSLISQTTTEENSPMSPVISTTTLSISQETKTTKREETTDVNNVNQLPHMMIFGIAVGFGCLILILLIVIIILLLWRRNNRISKETQKGRGSTNNDVSNNDNNAQADASSSPVHATNVSDISTSYEDIDSSYSAITSPSTTVIMTRNPLYISHTSSTSDCHDALDADSLYAKVNKNRSSTLSNVYEMPNN